MIRFLVFVVLISFISPEFLFSEPNKSSQSSRKKTSKKANPKKGSSKKTGEDSTNTISREDAKFFHENSVLEEVLFPSNEPSPDKEISSITPIPQKDSTPTPAKEVKPVIPKTPVPEKQGGVLDFIVENKKAIIVSFVILIFALYRLRGGPSSRGDIDRSPRLFSRLKDK